MNGKCSSAEAHNHTHTRRHTVTQNSQLLCWRSNWSCVLCLQRKQRVNKQTNDSEISTKCKIARKSRMPSGRSVGRLVGRSALPMRCAFDDGVSCCIAISQDVRGISRSFRLHLFWRVILRHYSLDRFSPVLELHTISHSKMRINSHFFAHFNCKKRLTYFGLIEKRKFNPKKN